MRELEAARKLYQEANRMNPGWPYWGFLMAQGDLVETQWLVQTKGPKERAKALFPQIETRFRLWLKSSASQFAWNRLAELYVTWAQNGYPQAISLGIEAALKSVALDKSYGPGYYRLGELESLAYHSGGPGSEAARAKARTAFLKAGELDPLKQQEIPKRLKEL